jgi:hypothetical protein
MANLSVKDHDAAQKYLKASGAGSDVDPHIVEHEVTQDTAADLNVTEASAASILADTANMDTNLGTVAGAIAGTEMQVDVVAALPAGDNNIGNVDIASALPAGANAIGKLAANDGVDIGDVTLNNPTIEVVGDAAENAAVAGNPVLVGGRYDATPRTLGDGDVGALALDADGAVHISDGGNTITVDGSVSIGSALPAGDNNIGNVDIASALPAGDNNIGNVDIASELPAGTQNIGDVDIASALPAGDNNIGNVDIQDVTVINAAVPTTGDEAHDAVDAGNPIKLGGRAQEPEAQPEEVADNDRVDALFDRNGYQRVRGEFDPGYAAINHSTSGDNTIVAAAGVGKRIAVWSVLLVSDGTVDVRFEDGAGGTALTGQIPLEQFRGFSYSAGGLVPLWIGSANTLLNLELSAAVNVHGHLSYTVMDD